MGFFQRCAPDGTHTDLPVSSASRDVVAYFGTCGMIGDLRHGISVAAAATATAASFADSDRPHPAVHRDTANLSPIPLVAARAFVRRWAHLFDVPARLRHRHAHIGR